VGSNTRKFLSLSTRFSWYFLDRSLFLIGDPGSQDHDYAPVIHYCLILTLIFLWWSCVVSPIFLRLYQAFDIGLLHILPVFHKEDRLQSSTRDTPTLGSVESQLWILGLDPALLLGIKPHCHRASQALTLVSSHQSSLITFVIASWHLPLQEASSHEP